MLDRDGRGGGAVRRETARAQLTHREFAAERAMLAREELRQCALTAAPTRFLVVERSPGIDANSPGHRFVPAQGVGAVVDQSEGAIECGNDLSGDVIRKVESERRVGEELMGFADAGDERGIGTAGDDDEGDSFVTARLSTSVAFRSFPAKTALRPNSSQKANLAIVRAGTQARSR